MVIHPLGFGNEAHERLKALVGDVKEPDPLAPVTVIVRDNIAALSVRRALAAGVAGRRGIAAVDVTTLRRIAEHLIAAAGLTRAPVTAARVAALVRAGLRADPGSLEPVADHPATIRAVARVHRELRAVDDAALEAIASSVPLGADLVRLHHEVTGRALDGHMDEAAVLTTASELVKSGGVDVEALGAIILHLPDELSLLERELVEALGAVTPIAVILGTTGEPGIDGPALEQFEARAGDATSTPAHATRILHASDADDEVRVIAREVVAQLGTGTPGHRVAVLYSRAVPYARLLNDHLAAAGIRTNGPGVRSLRDRAVADAFLSLLALHPDELSRVALFDFLGRAPIRTATGAAVPRMAWERISRETGVTTGDWAPRLSAHRRRLATQLDARRADAEASPGSVAALERKMADAQGLEEFVTELAVTLRAGRRLGSWVELGAWALMVLRRYLGSAGARSRLPEVEQRAATAIEATLTGLGELDAIGEPAGLDELIDILEIELDQRRPRVGRFGEGVFVGPIGAAPSLHLDAVFVLGLSEDLYPGRQAADPLLPDDVRRLAGGALATSRDRLRGMHRALAAAFAAAPSVTASFPRGDLRRGSERLPSRWLMPSLRALTGNADLAATRWSEAPSPRIVSVPSHWRGITGAAVPSTEQEWRLRNQAAGGALADDAVDLAVTLAAARDSDDFTRFDGNLDGVAGLPDYADGVTLISPTALERYAGCPHTFFVERLLGVSAIETPEDIVTIRPMDIGNIVHEVMDRLTRQCHEDLPAFGEPWTPEHRERMREIAAQVMTDYEQRGLTGHPRLWKRERELLLADLEALLDADDEHRAQNRSRILASELRFGMGGVEPVRVAVDGGEVALRGSADRVDETEDGRIIVTDFKTGKADSFSEIESDPVVAGTKLQLPLYAHAARAAYGADQVEALYWFVGRRSRGRRIPLRLDDEVEARYRFALGALVRGIREGRFIARPPKGDDFAWVQCGFCNPDGVGYGHIRAGSERKSRHPVLSDLFALLDPTIHATGQEDR